MANSPEDLIARSSDRWKHCEGTEEITLLRLAMLRELIQVFHAEKSRCLATGKKDEAQQIRNWEARIHHLRDTSSLQDDLLTLLQNALNDAKEGKKISKRTRL